MGVFSSKESKEDKKQAKLQEALNKYELGDLDTKYGQAVKNIQSGLMGTGLLEFGSIFSASGEDNAKLSYLRTLIDQNWIIIRQLDEISKKLDK